VQTDGVRTLQQFGGVFVSVVHACNQKTPQSATPGSFFLNLFINVYVQPTSPQAICNNGNVVLQGLAMADIK
jgi:hypothetical protein